MDVSSISWTFSFPSSRDDLLVSDCGQYHVEQIVQVHNIAANLSVVGGCVKKRARWSWWMLEHFDTFFSILLKFKTLEPAIKEEAWSCIVSGIEQQTEVLARVFSSSERLDSQDKLAHLNTLKMSLYLLVELLDCFEEENKSSNQIVTAKKKGAKKGSDPELWSNEEREQGLQALRRLLDLNLALLWDPPVVPEEFVDQVANLCYKLLEQADVGKSKVTCDYIFHVLGILIKRYNHCMGACMKLTQLLQQYEHLASPIASMMCMCVRDYDMKNVVSQMIRELAQISPNELVRDANATRNYCNFLMDVTETCAPVVLTVISSLLPHVDGDSYTMRNCVLTIIGDLISSLLNEDNMTEQQKETRSSLFDRLELHIHDQNAFVRSKAVQIWTKLVKQRCVPIHRQHQLVDLIVGAIQDKSSNVRKNALVFITTYLACNPYAAQLSLESMQEKLEEEKGKLKELEDDLPNMDTEDGTMPEMSSEVQAAFEAAQKQEHIVDYLSDSVKFTLQMHRVILLVSQLLASKSPSDVLESIDFLVSAYEFGLKAATLGIRKMLVLVFNQQESVRDAVVNAYIKLYINPDSGKASPETIANNLMTMTYGATLGELMSLEELVKLLLEKELISPRVTKVLLDVLVEQAAPQYALNAVTLILTMIAGHDHTLVQQNISLLISAGLGGNVTLAKNVCLLLQKAKPSKKEQAAGFERLSESHLLFTSLIKQLQDTFESPGVDWLGLCEQAVKLIYDLAEVPDTVCKELLVSLSKRTFPDNKGDMLDMMEDHSQDMTGSGLSLYRVLHLVGHIALCQLVHLDVSTLSELKRRAAVRERRDEKKQLRRDLNTTSEVDAAQEELGLEGATADDTESEHIREVLEKEILSRGLLADYTPLIRNICLSPNLFPCPRVQSVAVLALAKLMMVSSEFCDENINLLFTILDKSHCEKTRCNIMVSLHDLVMRFPNLLVNWTPDIYARLRDDSVMVRKTTIRVLTNLILNDMVKVKGQISELAVCLEDKEAHIRSLTQLFFTELGKKSNAIYNVLPDIISHLSDPDTGRSSEEFQSIMKYLFEFVEKDKQAESLVEKLCHRFRATRTDRQWHDLSFCLSLIQYSDKSLKQLSDNLVCYHDKMADNTVYENFNLIIEKCRKNIKFDHKELVDEFEVKVKVCHGRGGEGEEAPTEEILLQMKNLLSKGHAPKAQRNKKKVEKEDDKEDIRSPRRSRKKVRAKLPSTSDDEDDLKLPEINNNSDSDLDVFAPKTKRRGRKGRA